MIKEKKQQTYIKNIPIPVKNWLVISEKKIRTEKTLEILFITDRSYSNIQSSKQDEENLRSGGLLVICAKQRRACKHCYSKTKTQKLVSTYCNTCDVLLCVKLCFYKYHLIKGRFYYVFKNIFI
ncbi:hypothetical protein CDIK_4011 [Cucumispora dikerogammari]|nr:hypothetical protein CDIK_4011 [Cucumispora dikerogammari]